MPTIKKKGKDFAVHSLVQKILLDEVQDKSVHLKTIKTILQVYAENIPEDYPALYKYINNHRNIIPNIEKLLTITDKYKVTDYRTIILQIRLLRMYIIKNMYDKSDALMSTIENNIAEYVKTYNNPDLRSAITNYYIAKSYIYDYKYGDFKTSLVSLNNAFAYLENTDTNYETYYSLLCTLVQTQVYAGYLENAKDNLKKVKEIILSKKITSDIGFYYFLKSKIEAEEGLNKEAIESIKEAIKIDSTEFGKSEKYNIFTLYNYLILAELLLNEGEIKEAYKIVKPLFDLIDTDFRDSVEVRSKVMVLASRIGALFEGDALSRIEKAINLIKSKNNFEQDSELADAYEAKADILSIKGKEKEALKWYIQAFKVHKLRYEENLQLYSTSRLINKIVKKAIELKESYTAKQFYLLHKQAFGFEHANTKKIFKLLCDNKINI